MPQKQDDPVVILTDLSPPTAVLSSMVNQDLGWRRALAELVDNAFDAGATNVGIEFGPATPSGGARFMTIRDDGDGCEDLTVMVVPGARRRSLTSRLGCYGIGAKDASLWIGGETCCVYVESIYKGRERSLNVNWALVVSSGSWKYDTGATDEAADTGRRGTVVTIKPVTHRVPDGSAWNVLVEDLGYLYWPAIRDGKQITLRAKTKGSAGKPVPRWEQPPIDDVVDCIVDVEGKKAHVRAGIVPTEFQGQNKRPGLTYVHNFRVIRGPGSAGGNRGGDGCGGLDYSRVCGVVELTDGWVLTKNKDNISTHSEELYDAVFVALEGLLRKAETLGHTIESAQFLTGVESLINRALGRPDGKAVRGSGDKTGTKRPTGRGRRHRQAAHEQDGATFLRRGGGSIGVSMTPQGEAGALGRFDGTSRIFLNKEHVLLADAMHEGNRKVVAVVAISILVAACTLSGGSQTVIAGFDAVRGLDPAEKFNGMLGELTSKSLVLDGRDMVGPKPVCVSPGGDAE